MADSNDPPRRPAPTAPPFDVADDDPRLDALVPEIARRLAPLCESMPADEFDRLVRAIARTRLRWP